MAEDAKALYEKASALQAAGELEGAISTYREAVEVDGDRTSQIHYNLGTALAAHGDSEGAEAAYRRCIELDPRNVYAIDNLGAVLQGVGRVDDAMQCYRHALEIDPDNAWAHAALGGLLYALGENESAVQPLMAAIALEPADVTSLINLGMVQVRLKRWSGAERSFRRAIEAQPDSSIAHYNLAVALDGLGKLDEAIAFYNDGLALSPDNADALRNMGAAFCKLGRTADALDAYTRALEIDPDDEVAAHLVAAMSGQNTSSTPRGYIRRVFDDYAENYDDHLLGKLAYRVPDLVREQLDRLAPEVRFEAVLDLGCGTGLVGVRMRDRVDVLHGVDLSPNMIALAEATGVYEELHLGAIVDYLEAAAEPVYDLLTAADVVIYFGDLSALISSAAARMTAGGRFVFSVEHLIEGDYLLHDSGRYGHSAEYIGRLAGENGLSVAASDEIVLRLQSDAPVAGRLYMLSK